jgi:pimeloyl-ACP methyl ester carboxylesterase
MFGAVLFLAGVSKPPSLPKWGKSMVCYLTWAAFFLTLLTVIVGAGALGFCSVVYSIKLPATDGVWLRIREATTLTALLAGFLIVIASAARGLKRSTRERVSSSIPFVIFFVLSFALFAASFVIFLGSCAAAFGEAFLSVNLSFLPEWALGFLGSSLWVWPFLLLLAYEVRQIFIEYVGDVAVYVTPNKLDRFCEIRQKIKDLAYNTASAVYFAQDGAGFLYDKIAVVGHSLGSVIAYDTLNRLLNEDQLAFTKFGAIERTCLLETFGSPLDKIAFFFTIEGKSTFEIREQLAAVVQPLISLAQSDDDIQPRNKIPWVNVYSPNDIVSGKVQLYDLPEPPSDQAARARIAAVYYPPLGQNPDGVKAVDRVVDPDAVIPLVAHVEYWKNKTVWTKLRDALTA